MVRKAYQVPAYRLGQAVQTAVVDSSDPDEVYEVGGEIVVVDAITEIEMVKLAIEAVQGQVVAARVSWLSPAFYEGGGVDGATYS